MARPLEKHTLHVLDVYPSSPASAAGLDAFNDYILGVGDLLYDGPDEFGEIVAYNCGRPVRLYVYSSRTEAVREVTITPSKDWGGEGCLGCGVGCGYLHSLPRRRTKLAASATRTSAAAAAAPATGAPSAAEATAAAAVQRPSADVAAAVAAEAEAAVEAAAEAAAAEAEKAAAEAAMAGIEGLYPPPPRRKSFFERARQAIKSLEPSKAEGQEEGEESPEALRTAAEAEARAAARRHSRSAEQYGTGSWD